MQLRVLEMLSILDQKILVSICQRKYILRFHKSSHKILLDRLKEATSKRIENK